MVFSCLRGGVARGAFRAAWARAWRSSKIRFFLQTGAFAMAKNGICVANACRRCRSRRIPTVAKLLLNSEARKDKLLIKLPILRFGDCPFATCDFGCMPRKRGRCLHGAPPWLSKLILEKQKLLPTGQLYEAVFHFANIFVILPFILFITTPLVDFCTRRPLKSNVGLLSSSCALPISLMPVGTSVFTPTVRSGA